MLCDTPFSDNNKKGKLLCYHPHHLGAPSLRIQMKIFGGKPFPFMTGSQFSKPDLDMSLRESLQIV